MNAIRTAMVFPRRRAGTADRCRLSTTLPVFLPIFGHFPGFLPTDLVHFFGLFVNKASLFANNVSVFTCNAVLFINNVNVFTNKAALLTDITSLFTNNAVFLLAM